MFWAWHLSTRGKTKPRPARIPLDADPATGRPLDHDDTGLAGRIQEEHQLLFTDGAVDELWVKVLKKGEEADPGLPIWLSHFATCPDSEEHRKTR